MAMSVEQKRKICGIREPKDPADPEVLSRRHLHEAAAKFAVKWTASIHLISLAIAISVVLIPGISPSWRAIVLSIPLLAWIFNEFSGLRFWSISFLIITLTAHIYSNLRIDGKNHSGYGYPINLAHVRSAREIVEAELYPRTSIEERIFWIDRLNGLLVALTVWPIKFGAIAFFIMKGVK